MARRWPMPSFLIVRIIIIIIIIIIFICSDKNT